MNNKYEVNEFTEINKKIKYHIGDKVFINNKECEILFGPYDKGFHSFYEIEENGQIYSVNSKSIQKKKNKL